MQVDRFLRVNFTFLMFLLDFQFFFLVIFTSCLKRGNYGAFSSLNAFNSHFDNSLCLKRCLQSWNSTQPPEDNDHFKPKLSLCCCFAMKWKRHGGMDSRPFFALIGVLESPWKVLNFFFQKKVCTLFKYLISSSNFIYSLALKLISRLKPFCRRYYIYQNF